jgi:hypothetical protein
VTREELLDALPEKLQKDIETEYENRQTFTAKTKE